MSEPSIDLNSEGVRELIRLTNDQFEFWREALAHETDEPIPSGDLMDYWFIFSALALCPDFKMDKKQSFSKVPNLAEETVRKHAARAQGLGFVQTVGLKGELFLELAPAGQRALASTMSRWIREFGEIHRKHFSDPPGPAKGRRPKGGK